MARIGAGGGALPGVVSRSSQHAGLLACALITLLAAVEAARAQSYRVSIFGEADGLPSSQVRDLAQDRSGRLWIATTGGVASYDGRRFRPVSPATGLLEDDPAAVSVDEEGTVWIVSASPPVVVHYRTGARWQRLAPLPPPSSPTGQVVTALAAAGGAEGQTVAVGTRDQGLFLWREGGPWRRLQPAEELPHSHVTALAAVGSRIFVATAAGLCTLEAARSGCRPVAREGRLAGDIRALWPAAGAAARGEEPPRLWVLGEGWVGYVTVDDASGGDVTEDDLTVVAESLVLDELPGWPEGSEIAYDGQAGVYLGSRLVVKVLDLEAGTLSGLGQANGLAAEGASTLFVDRERNLWVGSVRGLSRLGSRRFANFGRRDGLLEDEVSAIVEFSPGRLLFGHNTGISVWSPEGVTAMPFTAGGTGSLPVTRVMEAARGPGGELWIAGVDGGLGRYRPGGEVEWLSRRLGLPAEAVLSVQVEPSGALWVVDGGRLYRKAAGSRRFRLVDLGQPAPGTVRRVLLDGETVFVATDDGLLLGQGTGWRRIRSSSSADANEVYGACRDRRGTIWVGTRGGLYRVEGERLIRADLGGRTLERPVFVVLEGPRGELWAGTDDGVFLWDGRELRQLTVQHGLAGRETNRGAMLMDGRGDVWIGTDQGVSRYQRRFDLVRRPPPLTDLEELEVGQRRFPLAEPMELSFRQQDITLHFQAISLVDDAELFYRWRLEGFDEGWRTAASLPEGGVRYTDLPPGQYRLRVQAGRRPGRWGPEAASALLTLAKAPWRRPSFYPPLLAAAVLLALGTRRLGTALRRRFDRDPLTGLPGRQRLLDRVEAAIAEGSGWAVLYVDVDRLKQVNEGFDHQAGDRLLAVVARRLRQALGPFDLAARLASDEIGVFLGRVEGEEGALRRAQALLGQLVTTVQIGEQEIPTSASGGLAVSSHGYRRAGDALRDAAAAMSRSKGAVRGRLELFRPGRAAPSRSPLELEAQLRRALEGQQLILEYQPIISLEDGAISAVEALVRWQHPERGTLGPKEFIPVAEEAGLIDRLGEWVLRQACRDFTDWRRQAPAAHPASLNVNLSARQLQPRLVSRVTAIVAEQGVEPSRLCFEITESVFLEGVASAVDCLRSLAEGGFRISIDDFSMGYSSLGYLKDLPAGSFKIDRVFVASLGQERGSLEIVRSLVSLGHSLSLEVIAEGVETPRQLMELRKLGCDAAQGYLFARPMPAGEIPALLASWEALPAS